MILTSIIAQAFRTLGANKVRSALTVLGIVIGIASVITLISAGRGAEQLIVKQVQGAGSNLIFIFAGGSQEGRTSAPASTQGVVVTSLTAADADALAQKKLAPSVGLVSPEARGAGKLEIGQYEKTISYFGVAPEYFTIRSTNVARGDAIAREHVASLATVAVLGDTLARDAFGETDPIGKSIRINRRTFRIIGILEEKGLGPGGVDMDNAVIIPVSTAQKLLLGIDYVPVINVSAKDGDSVDIAVAEIEQVLLDRHKISDPAKADFTIRTANDVLAILETVTGALTLFLAAIAGISLLVGGIGIMNIMLVAVTERTREIGLRKAVGATRSNILLQFLIEAVFLTLLGGVIGILIGVSGSAGIALIGGWTPTIYVDAILLATGVSAAFGIIFGLYPASKASKLNPIDALRYE